MVDGELWEWAEFFLFEAKEDNIDSPYCCRRLDVIVRWGSLFLYVVVVVADGDGMRYLFKLFRAQFEKLGNNTMLKWPYSLCVKHFPTQPPPTPLPVAFSIVY